MNSIELDPQPLPADGTFELGLVLAGAISAGAYIGGVLDYLIEALDAWETAKIAQGIGGVSVPSHRVVLKVVTGASGGAMNAGIMASTLGCDYNHVAMANAPVSPTQTNNPFFDAWVNDIDIMDLLGLQDLGDGKSLPPSVLDCTKLDQIAAAAFTQPPGSAPKSRPWTADPLRIFLTLGNLRGVPYSISMEGNVFHAHGMLMHADHARFAVNLPGGSAAPVAYPNERSLNTPANISDQNWKGLADAALASGAFPIGLKPRVLQRPYADYASREYYQASGIVKTVPPDPLLQGQQLYSSLNVDGGIVNNEPIDLCHAVLAGAYGTNPPEGNLAKRALLLVDPFPENPDLGASLDTVTDAASQATRPFNPVDNLLALMDAWKNQSRFKPVDLALAQDETIFSRFRVTPDRGPNAPVSNGKNLAAGMVGGFGGFLCWDFRLHDYLLGRRNCERFLQQHLTLPEDNSLFDGWKDPALRAKFYADPQPGDTVKFLPIIPVVSRPPQDPNPTKPEEPLPTWPQGKFDLSTLQKPIGDRFDAFWSAGLNQFGAGWLAQTYLGPARRSVKDAIWKKVSANLAQEMKAYNL